MTAKIRRLSKVTRKADIETDSVERSKARGNRAFDILYSAKTCWENMERFRRDRERNKRYTYGDQWKDIICVDGRSMSEEQYIKEQGNVPLKNNLIRRLVRNVLGVYRSQSKEPICQARDRDEQQEAETMSTVLQYNGQLNKLNELYARTMEEFLISGFVAHKKWYGWRRNQLDCWTDYVQPNNFIIDSNGRDFRGWDATLVGEIHDESLGSILSRFAKAPEDYSRITKIYGQAREVDRFTLLAEEFGYNDTRNLSFFMPKDPTRCRVFEIWRKEQKARYRCHDYNSGELFKIDIEDYQSMVANVNADRIAKGMMMGIPEDDIPFLKESGIAEIFTPGTPTSVTIEFIKANLKRELD